jgi:hypothetical protein
MFNSLKDIQMLDDTKILGEGTFSQVVKARSNVDGKIYALKLVG